MHQSVSGWVSTDRHDLAPRAADGLHRATMSVSDMIGGTGTLVHQRMELPDPGSANPVSRMDVPGGRWGTAVVNGGGE